MEPHGTIIEGRLKGTRCALVRVVDPPAPCSGSETVRLEMVVVRVFDCADPSFSPEWPIRIPRAHVLLDSDAPKEG